MKDSEFIELLNLYVDHEITPADAARLEAEVVGNPERARIYRQYCGMQKACMILADQFREKAPAEAAGMIAGVAPHRGGWAVVFGAAGLVAAACLALVVIAHRPGAAAQYPNAARLAQAEQPAAPAAAPAVAAMPLDAGLQTIFSVRRPGSNGDRIETTALLASGGQQDPFAWMNQLQLTPIQRVAIEPFLFDPKSSLEQQGRGFNIAQPQPQGQVETTAFKLQLDK
jgi:hypothetical protein